VKRLFSDKTIREESFHREVDNLMTVKHQNIVQFLGFCANTENIPIKDPESEDYVKYIYVEKRERLLCFEYMSNGSLRRHLTGARVDFLLCEHVFSTSLMCLLFFTIIIMYLCR